MFDKAIANTSDVYTFRKSYPKLLEWKNRNLSCISSYQIEGTRNESNKLIPSA